MADVIVTPVSESVFEVTVSAGGVGGLIAAEQVAFGIGNNAIGGVAGFTFNSGTGLLTLPAALKIGSLPVAIEPITPLGRDAEGNVVAGTSGIGGTIAANQVAFGAGVNTVGGDSGLTWDNTLKSLSLGGFNLAPIHVGNRNLNNSTRAQILISREILSSSGNDHAFSDSSLYAPIGSLQAYNSFDSRTNVGGDTEIDHYAGFQNITQYNNNNIVRNHYSVFSRAIVNTGKLNNYYGFHEFGVSGNVDRAYAFYSEGLTANIESWGIYLRGTMGNFINGSLSIGTLNRSRKFQIVTGNPDPLSVRISSREDDLTNKVVKIGSLPFNTSQNDVTIISQSNSQTSNILLIGGGSSFQQSVTNTWFYAASTVNTATGTVMMNLSVSGLSIGNGTTVSSNPLDVNGTARIRTVNNATGSFATYSATGVLQQRTALESSEDILKAISGYSAGVQQRLEHNSSGVLNWINV